MIKRLLPLAILLTVSGVDADYNTGLSTIAYKEVQATTAPVAPTQHHINLNTPSTASVSISLPRPRATGGFRILDDADWQSVKLYLIPNNQPGQTYTPSYGPFIIDRDDVHNSDLITFHAVPPGDYHIAASGYRNENGLGTNTTIEKPGEGMLFVNDGGVERAYATDKGGIGDTGLIRVETDNSVTGGSKALHLDIYVREDD